MATYTFDLSTDTGKFRLEIGDGVQDKGPRPGGRNFSDEEIAYFFELEGDDWGRAKARAHEVLATEWASANIEEKVGPMREKKRAYDHHTEIAEELRQAHGYTDDAPVAARVPSGTQQITVDPGR